MDNKSNSQNGGSELAVLVDLLCSTSKDEAVLDRIQRTMIRIVADDPSCGGMLQKLIDDHHKAGHLDEHSLILVRATLDRLVAEQAMTPAEAESTGADLYGATTVLADLTDLKVSAESRLQVGSILQDRYLLRQRIASDDMWTVYKATDRQLSNADGNPAFVAVKVLAKRLLENKEAIRALQQEVAKGRYLSHPSIGRTYDLVREDDVMFVVAEWLEGKTLAAILDERGGQLLPQAESMAIVGKIADALEYAHRCGVVHGDLRPANIMISPSGEAKLFDFGSARIWQKEFGRVAAERRTGPSIHKPTYASMQILTGEESAPADDVFSLAYLFYRLIAGYRVFGPRNAAEAAEAGMEPQRPQSVTDGQWKALKRSLAFSRVTRIATPTQLVTELGVAAPPSPSPSPSAPAQAPAQAPTPTPTPTPTPAPPPIESIAPTADRPTPKPQEDSSSSRPITAKPASLTSRQDRERSEPRIDKTSQRIEPRSIPPLTSEGGATKFETTAVFTDGPFGKAPRNGIWSMVFATLFLVVAAGLSFQYQPWKHPDWYTTMSNDVTAALEKVTAGIPGSDDPGVAAELVPTSSFPEQDITVESVPIREVSTDESTHSVAGDSADKVIIPSAVPSEVGSVDEVVVGDMIATVASEVPSIDRDGLLTDEPIPPIENEAIAQETTETVVEPDVEPVAVVKFPTYEGERQANVTIPLPRSGASKVELFMTMRENDPPLIIEVSRGANTESPQTLKFVEVAYDGNASPWNSGRYKFPNAGRVEFMVGQSISRTTVTMRTDPLREADRQVILELQDANFPDVIFAKLTLILEDDDQRSFESSLAPDTIGFAVSQASVKEQDHAVQVDVIRFNAGGSELVVDYTVRDVTATEGLDYFAPAVKTIRFQPGQRFVRLLIPLVQDSEVEADEAFTLELAPDSAATSAGVFRRMIIMIRDDDS